MIGRAAPGPRVSTGRIRVDAAKAIAKLRDYQLVDRRTWVLEAIRAAVASGAIAVTLTGDADDVWLAWAGEPWPGEALPALFDELVSPEPARASQHLRLLATAVNSALGLGPAFVDVYAVTPGGPALRVRYTPDVLAPAADDDTGLRRLAVTPAPAPGAAPARGMLVHLRRRLGFGALANLVRGEPPELAIARGACTDASVPITIAGVVHARDGVALAREQRPRDLLREPLGEGLDAFLALVDPSAPRDPDHEARLEVAEHGVVLARYGLTFAQVAEAPRAAVPLRVLVDAPRMPTNASRSEVRRDAHPIAAAEQRAAAVLPALLERLATELAAEATAPDRRARLRDAALMLIAARIAGDDWVEQVEQLGPPLASLAALPLLTNAVGAARAVSAPWTRGIVHVRDPFPVELEPWLGRIVMMRKGDPAVFLLGYQPIDARAARTRARRARRALRAQQKFARHAPRPAVVDARMTPRVRLALGGELPGTCGKPELFAGLAGEVCLLPGDGPGELVLLHDEREIEELELVSPIPFQAVLAPPDLRPTERYRGVVRNAAFTRAEVATRAAVVRAAEAIAALRLGLPVPATVTIDPAAGAGTPAECAMLRRAFAIAADIGRTLGDDSPLARAPIWPTVGGGRVSLAQLGRTDVIGTTSPGATLRVPRGRTIIEVDAADQAVLAARCPHLVVYPPAMEEALDPAATHARQLHADTGQVALAVRGEGFTAAIGLSRVAWIRYFHLGKQIDSELFVADLVTSEIYLDDDGLIPDADWNGTTGRRPLDVVALQRYLLRAIARAILGDAEPDLVRPSMHPLSLDGDAGLALCRVIADHGRPEEVLGADLVARLRRFEVATLLGKDRPCAIEELGRVPTPAIPYLETRPMFPIDGWHPLIADAIRARAFGKLVGRAVHDAKADLATRRRAAVRAQSRVAHRTLHAPVSLALPATTPQVPLVSPVATGVVGVGDRDRLVLQVHVERRKLGSTELADDLPLVALVDVADSEIDDAFAALKPEARDAVAVAVRAAAVRLIAETVAADPRRVIEHAGLTHLLWRLLSRGGVPAELRAQLIAAPMFPTIQGGLTSIAAARDNQVVRTAAWPHEWLAAGAREAPHALDGPVIAVFEDEAGGDRRAIVETLAEGRADLTEAVIRLQTRRRVAGGLLAPPTVPGADPALTRRLDQLGPIAERLAPGEVALVDLPGSAIIPYVNGRQGAPITVDVKPSIRIAVEAPDLAGTVSLSPETTAGRWGHLPRIARDLVHQIVASTATLPAWARRRLRAAVLGRAIEPGDVGAAPIFETTAEEWVPWSRLVEQRARFGTVWFTNPGSRALPLDPDRLAFRLTGDEAHAAPHTLDLLDATEELRLDQLARDNQRRAPVTSLELTSAELAGVMRNGTTLDDTTGRRGVVLPLAPGAATLRGVRAHRQGFPFDKGDDPCAWPTITIVDEPALAPGRTWSRPADDAAWQALVERIRAASTEALRGTLPPPDDAVCSHFVEPRGGLDTVTTAGWLWLDGPSAQPATWLDGPGEVRVTFADGEQRIIPGESRPLRGWLAVTAPRSMLQQSRLEQLFEEVHARLLRDAAGRYGRDAAATHLAAGLRRGVIDPGDVSEAQFTCFAPRPLDARELRGLINGNDPVPLIRAGERADSVSLVADETALSRYLIARFGKRLVHADAAPPPPRMGRDATTPASRPAPALLDPPAAAPPHALQGLVDAVWTRLGEIGLGAGHVTKVVLGHGRRSPLVRQADGVIELAADHHRLGAIEAARLARSPWAPAAVDALVAHVVTVLNIELTSVTDAAEAAALTRLLASTK